VIKENNFIIESVKITNPDKLLFNKSKITKLDLIKYYQKIAPRMMPYLENRIISAIRCPDGIDGTCFYKKHLDTKSKQIGRIYLPNNNGSKEDYYYIKDISGLIAEVQMNTIEFHIWGSKVEILEQPDIIVFDLDPDEGLDIKAIREGAKDLKKILDLIPLTSFLKTSGGKGYHVVIPITPSANWEKVREFSKNIAEVMVNKWPEKYTENVRKINRQGKIFIDWMRNIKGATSVAPYSVRTKEKGSVSMPISWSELDKINPDIITMNEAIKRLKRKDPWEDFYTAINMPQVHINA